MAAAVLALLLAGVQPGEAAITTELDGLRAAWRSGDVMEIAERAEAAVAAIENSACPLRADAAIAGAMGGLASYMSGTPGVPGYSFWVADQVNAELDVLPEMVRRLAELAKTEPGGAIGLDDEFLASPYLDTGALATSCADAELDPALLTQEPQEATALILAFYWPRDMSRTYYSRAELIWAYPALEGAALFRELQEHRSDYPANEGVEVRVFDPCIRLPGRNYEYFDICREGAAP